MKNTHTCPKCHSLKVVLKKGSAYSNSGKVQLNTFRTAIIDRYICGDCGYFEMYAQNTSGFIKWTSKELKKNPNDDHSGYV